MRRPALAAATSLLLFLSATGQGASRDRHADCAQDDDLDLSIASCTSILNNANENACDRAVAYVNRGLAWHDRHMRIRALADYSEAVGIAPTLAVAYHRRGQVWSKEGDVDRAIADYTQAIFSDRTEQCCLPQ